MYQTSFNILWMRSVVTSKNERWPCLIWLTLYVSVLTKCARWNFGREKLILQWRIQGARGHAP